MFAKSSAVIALLTVAAQVAVAAQPPACVIAAVNTESDPSDFQTICGSEKAQSYLTENCGNNLKAAQSYFEDICKTNGHEVTLSENKDDEDNSSSSTRSSSSSSPSATASSSDEELSATTETASITGSNTYGASESSPSATSSQAASSTGAASSVRLGMDVLGMDVLGMGALLSFGAMLAL